MKKIALLFLSAIIISSCGSLKKMKDLANSVKYEATPKVLEMNNNEVKVDVSVNFPAKYFNKKAVLTLIPTIKYEGGELELTPLVLQGEAVQENNKAVAFLTGGSFTTSDKFTYKEEMMRSEVVVKVKAIMKKEQLEIGTFKVADGIIITPKLVQIDSKPAYLADKFQRVISESRTADIKYLINKYDVRPNELKKAEIKALNEYVKSVANNPKFQLKGIEVSSYASPDGTVDLNTKLSGNREKSADKFLKSEFKKAKLMDMTKENFLSFLTTPEDWDGFKSLMEQSAIQDKELILRVLSMYSDPEVREKEIKNISKAYEEIAEKILPELRRSKFIVKADAIGYSDEELIALADTLADSLKIEEILYAASLVQDLNKKESVYKKAAAKFPTDVRCSNNLGYVQIQLGKFDEAKTSLEAAKAIENNDAVKTNLGVLALKQGDLTAAEELFTSALAAGDAPNYNLGIINIIKGKYDIAKSYFGNSNGFNPALAKVLNKNYEEALATLNNSKGEEAIDYYLKAVVGARIENSDMFFNNLRTAVGKDGKLKAYAQKDVEFLKYFNDETFKSIVL